MCNSCTVEKNAYFSPLDFLLCEVEIFFQPGFIDFCLSLKWVVEASVRILEQGRVTDKLSSYSGQRIHGKSSSSAQIFGEMAPLGMGHSRWRHHGRGSAGLAVWAPQPWWCACRRTSVEHFLDGSYSSKHHACSGLGRLSILLPLYCRWETGAHLRFMWAMSSCRGPPPPTFRVPGRNPAATRCQDHLFWGQERKVPVWEGLFPLHSWAQRWLCWQGFGPMDYLHFLGWGVRS